MTNYELRILNVESSCQRVQSQARLNYAERSRTYVMTNVELSLRVEELFNYELSLRDYELRIAGNRECLKALLLAWG